MGLRIDGEALHGTQQLPGERIEQRQTFHLLVEQLDPQRLILRLGGENIDHLAAHPKGAARKRLIIAGVLQLRETTQNRALIDQHALGQMQHHLQIEIGITQAIDRRDRGDHHHIAPLQQRLGGRESHLLDMFVDRGILLDEGIGAGDIGFRLVIVIVGDEIFDRVVGKELLHLTIQLGGQRLVGRHHHGRSVEIGDHVGDGEGLPRAGHTQQRLMRQSILQPRLQATNRLGLIAGGLKGGMQFEGLTHGSLPHSLCGGRMPTEAPHLTRRIIA